MAARVRWLPKIRHAIFISKRASALLREDLLLRRDSSSVSKQKRFTLREYLQSRIKFASLEDLAILDLALSGEKGFNLITKGSLSGASGPITVAAFMQEVLINPIFGYYMNNDVFGEAGDFITSPEVSQVFGELIGVWFVNQWMMSGMKNVQLVELGPGRGTLAADVLRVFSKFPGLHKTVSLCLVEVSPALSQIQEKTLTGEILYKENNFEEAMDCEATLNTGNEKGVSSLCYKSRVTPKGVPVSWYRAVQDVPAGNSYFLAHEFFDALPVHQFQKTDKGWREVLVDVTQREGDSQQLRFVLAPGPTVASEALVPRETLASQLEVCPQGGSTVEHMCSVLAEHGGCALIVDYGEDGSTRHTLRAFKRHKLHNVLEDPGSADVTANVDFAYLRQATRAKVQTFGPVTQSFFLQRMGIDTRMEVLIRNSDSTQADQLRSGYKMLMSATEMGERFKFFSLVQHGLPGPAAFT